MAESVESPAPPKSVPAPNPNLLRDRLANERTFLSWLRTGIAITSLGFVVARFDIFLEELARVGAQPVAQSETSEAVIPIGVMLVLAGPVMVLLAAVRYLHTDRALVAGQPDSRRLVRNIVGALTVAAIFAGIGLALHLLATWPR